LQGSLLGLGATTSFIQYHRAGRPFGKSQWTFKKKLRLMIDIIIETSTAPLRAITLTGIIFSLVGFIGFIYLLYCTICNKESLGLTFEIYNIFSFFFGLLLTSIGVLGEYILRGVEESRESRSFLIKNIFR
jgi:dolichol-phosphate mannosyltransferase